MASFAGLLLWWLLSVALSMVAWPLSYHLFRHLPDRGLAFSRLLGWLFTGYVAWLLGFAFNHALTSVLAWGLLGYASFLVWRSRKQEMKAWAQQHGGLIFAYELAFLSLFVIWCLVRMKHPNIEGQEKFMDFAFFNAIRLDSQLPPADPWLAGPGNHINYYYFGYFLNTAFARLLPVSPDISYNLAVSNNFALCGLGALGLGYNLTRALWPGLISAAALLCYGNLHGALQVLGIQWQGSFNWWEPTRLIKDVVKDGKYLNAWWWSASPVSLAKAGLGADAARDGLISEFPAFSFLHGDLHPHFTALPLGLLVLGLGLNLVKDPAPAAQSLAPRWNAGSQAWLALLVALSALFMANTWDLPAYGLLASLLVLAQLHSAGRLGRDWAKQWLLPSAVLLGGLLALALPFLIFFENPAKGFGLHGARTGLRDSLVFWGVFIAALLPFIALKIRALALGREPLKTGLRGPDGAAPATSGQARHQTCAACGAKLRPGKAICGVCGARAQAPEAPTEAAVTEPAPAWTSQWKPGTRALAGLLGLGLLAAFVLAPSLALFSALALGAALIVAQRGGSREGAFVAVLVLVACFSVLLPELAYLRDVFEGNPSLTRMNTVFKFYFQAWVLFAVATGYALHWAWGRLQGAGLWRHAYLGAFAVLSLGALVYPAKAIAFVWADFDRWARFGPTLDGAAWMRRDMPADYAAIQRLRATVPGQPVIAEAVGGAYTRYARVSSYTGFKAVVGWGNHESQWRQEWPQAVERDVDELYNTADLGRARELLRRYQVEYVYVGQLEHEKYGAAGALAKFAQLGQPVLQELGVTVYKVNQ